MLHPRNGLIAFTGRSWKGSRPPKGQRGYWMRLKFAQPKPGVVKRGFFPLGQPEKYANQSSQDSSNSLKFARALALAWDL